MCPQLALWKLSCQAWLCSLPQVTPERPCPSLGLCFPTRAVKHLGLHFHSPGSMSGWRRPPPDDHTQGPGHHTSSVHTKTRRLSPAHGPTPGGDCQARSKLQPKGQAVEATAQPEPDVR